jgi:hypothetical protein
VSWAEVCAATGRRAHALMQWRAVSGVAETTTGDTSRTHTTVWDGTEPSQGDLEPDALAVLCQVLSRHTEPGTGVFFALWDGHGWIYGSPSVAIAGQAEPVPPALPAAILQGPRLHLPHRDYILFSGPLEAITELGHQVTRDWFIAQSPNLFWPADKSWCVATEIDFDSTLVAGSHGLIADVLGNPRLDAWTVDPDDSLAYDADTLNPLRTRSEGPGAFNPGTPPRPREGQRPAMASASAIIWRGPAGTGTHRDTAPGLLGTAAS